MFTDFRPLSEDESLELLRAFLFVGEESEEIEVITCASKWLFGRARLTTQVISNCTERGCRVEACIHEFVEYMTMTEGSDTGGTRTLGKPFSDCETPRPPWKLKTKKKESRMLRLWKTHFGYRADFRQGFSIQTYS